MASIYKRTRSYPIPAGAKFSERKRKATPEELRADPTRATIVEQWATWTDGKGRQRRGLVDASGKRVAIEARTYSIAYWCGGERLEVNSGTPDRDAAQTLANKLETEAMLRARGIIDATAERTAHEQRRPLGEHIAAFRATLEAANRDAKHIGATVGYIEQVTAAAGIERVGDITADVVNTYAADLLAKGKSARTVQAVVTACKSFTRWLTRHGKLASDPLAAVRKPSPASDRRHERRMILPDEWEWLRTITAQGAERYNMTGPERMLLYAVAVQTGLRASELASLTRGRLFLDSTPPYVTCKARDTKNKQDARLYLQADVAELLRGHIATKAPGAAVFAMPHIANAARMFRADLADARKAWLDAARGPEDRLRREQSDFLANRNHDGEVADFHCLRHTCGAWLARAGNHPKTVQTILRHSSITLTMDTYGHLFPGQESDAVANMPSLLGDDRQALRATGTETILPANRQQLSGETGQFVAKCGDYTHQGDLAELSPNVLRAAGMSETWRDVAEAGPLGFEPRLTDPESVVLPLHQGPKGFIVRYGGLAHGSR